MFRCLTVFPEGRSAIGTDIEVDVEGFGLGAHIASLIIVISDVRAPDEVWEPMLEQETLELCILSQP